MNCFSTKSVQSKEMHSDAMISENRIELVRARKTRQALPTGARRDQNEQEESLADGAKAIVKGIVHRVKKTVSPRSTTAEKEERRARRQRRMEDRERIRKLFGDPEAPRKMEGPSAIRWIPTSERELFKSEYDLFRKIRPMLTQKTIEGLNTIATIHEKRRKDDDGVGDISVRMVQTLPTDQQTSPLVPLDADNYVSIVMVHGFCGGVGNWLPGWRELAERHDVYAFDLPAFGRSDREERSFPTADSALDWFMDYFVKWFEAMQLGIEVGAGSSDSEGSKGRKKHASISQQRPLGRRIVLVGHSFGGYLCSIFASRYPHFVDQLILVDPWGIPRFEKPSKQRDPEDYEKRTALSFHFSRVLWDIFGTGGFVRLLGPAAIETMVTIRPEFKKQWAPYVTKTKYFYKYTYHCNASPIRTGEYAFDALIFDPMGPHFPLIDELNIFRPFGVTKANRAPLMPLTPVNDAGSLSGIQSQPSLANISPASSGHVAPFERVCEFGNGARQAALRDDENVLSRVKSAVPLRIVNAMSPTVSRGTASPSIATITTPSLSMAITASSTNTSSEFFAVSSPHSLCTPPNIGSDSVNPLRLETRRDSRRTHLAMPSTGSNPSIGSSPRDGKAPYRHPLQQPKRPLSYPYAYDHLPSRLRNVLVMFGTESWFYSKTVPTFVEGLTARGISTELRMIDKAGHQVMSDNQPAFVSAMLKFVETRQDTAQK